MDACGGSKSDVGVVDGVLGIAVMLSTSGEADRNP